MSEADPEYVAGAPIEHLGALNDAIPRWGPIHAYCWYAAQAGRLSPPAFLVGSFLPCLAHEAARRGYRWGRNQELPRIQSILVAPGASGKSTAVRLAQKFYQDALRATQGTWYRDPWIVAEGSIPGLMEVLSKKFDSRTQSTPALLVLEEFSRVLGAREHGFSEVLNQLFDGVTIERHLRGYQELEAKGDKAPSVVMNPAVSGLFATTFAALETTTTSLHRAGGFFSRLLWFVGPPGQLELDPDPAISARTSAGTVWTGWSAAVDAHEVLGDSKLLQLDRACKPVLQELVDEANAAIRRDPEDSLNPMRARAAILAQQVACLYAFSRAELVADVDDATRAAHLIRYCLRSVQHTQRRWYGVADNMRMDTILMKVEEAYEIIEKAEHGVSRSQLMRSMRLERPALDEALRILQEEGRIYELRSTGAGRTATKYAATVNRGSQPRGSVITLPVAK